MRAARTSASTASPMRRTARSTSRRRRRLLRIQLLQDVRPTFRDDGGALRQSARARRPVSLFLRPRPRADKARARQHQLRTRLGRGCIVDYLDGLGGGGGDRAAIERAFDDIAAHEEAIGDRLLAYLRDRNDVRIVGRRSGDRAIRVPTVSFKAEGRDSAAIVAAVDDDLSASATATSIRAGWSSTSASPRATASCASRWSTTTPSRKSTA